MTMCNVNTWNHYISTGIVHDSTYLLLLTPIKMKNWQSIKYYGHYTNILLIIIYN